MQGGWFCPLPVCIVIFDVSFTIFSFILIIGVVTVYLCVENNNDILWIPIKKSLQEISLVVFLFKTANTLMYVCSYLI